MLSRRGLFQSLLLGFVGTALAACQSRANLRLAIHPWIGYETFYLLEELGRLPSNILLEKYSNTSEKIIPLREGLLDGGTFNLDEVLSIREQGIPLTIVAILDVSAGADVVLVKNKPAQPPFIQANQRIGFEANQFGQLMLDLLLVHVGMTREKLRLYPVPVGDSQIEAWQRDKIDALITHEPYASKIKRLGGQIAYSCQDFPQRIFDVLAIRSDMLSSHVDSVKSLLAGHFAMLARIQQQPDDSLYRIASRKHLSFEEAKQALHGIILLSLTRNHQLLSQQGGQLQQAIVFIDLDGFESVNDTYGHHAGDSLLSELGSRFLTVMCSHCTIARIGGDEFVAVMTNLTSQESAYPILDQLLAVCNQPFLINGEAVNISASIGVDFYTPSDYDQEFSEINLIQQADKAMYIAKQQGKNQIWFFDRNHHDIDQDVKINGA
ncbi:MAG: GGDEF domain-containing protein [Gammaproteobacteria bacterium]|nr:GGDEF domain-containing protein [Gammaproteobacteria bacterium]